LILNEFYGTRLDFSKPLFYDIPTASGITRHYRILYNGDFLEILPTDQTPVLTAEDIERLTNSYDDLPLWREKFPPGSWVLKGFALMTLVDATVENAISILKEKFLGLTATDFGQSIASVFQSIFRFPDLRIGFTLYNPEENTFTIAPFGRPLTSFILPAGTPQEDKEVLCAGSYRSLVQQKTYFAVSDTAQFVVQHPESHLAARFATGHIRSFILAPVVKNEHLLGVLEVVSPRPHELNSINARKLEVIMPFLTDTIERLAAELQNQVQAIIQDNYTTLHASVSWKFRGEAQRLIRERQQGKKYQLQEIRFAEVYPLYGQIDVKGSSEARNRCVQLDLQGQLEALLHLLAAISRQDPARPLAEEKGRVTDLLYALSQPLQASTEQRIHHFLESRLHPLLAQIGDEALVPLVRAYVQHTDKQTGDFHAHRRRYETSLSWINEAMVSFLDGRQPAVQAQFPHYYERFKSDGVDHTLYIGASISPKHPFGPDHLHALRQWQLQVMWEMNNVHRQLKSLLPYPLEVTSLLLVQDSAINIRFRMDEKRFDVDGSYHARYEIIKKRIDKARIKDSAERITETGKITIVHSDDREAGEYRQYIARLQAQGRLEAEVETFEVEALQGISGLKALRVKIIYDPVSRQ
jgi:GAF domain-containing protein